MRVELFVDSLTSFEYISRCFLHEQLRGMIAILLTFVSEFRLNLER